MIDTRQMLIASGGKPDDTCMLLHNNIDIAIQSMVIYDIYMHYIYVITHQCTCYGPTGLDELL